MACQKVSSGVNFYIEFVQNVKVQDQHLRYVNRNVFDNIHEQIFAAVVASVAKTV